RQLRVANPILDRMPVAFFALHRQQRLQVADMAVVFLDRLFRQRYEIRGDHRHANRFAVLLDAGLLQRLRLSFHWITPVPLSNWSYSSITGNGRSNCANSSANRTAYRRRSSGSGILRICTTAAASLTPSRSASSTARISPPQSSKPARTNEIIS